MTIAKRITPALTVCAAAGWLAVIAPPAQATTHTATRPLAQPAGPATRVAGAPGRTARTCSYRLARVRAGSFLNVRNGPGLRHRPIGHLRAAAGAISGSCTARHGWIAVRTATGRKGWASAYYLRRRTHHQPGTAAGRGSSARRPRLDCSYRLAHVRAGSFLNVRNGPGLRHRPIGHLRAAAGAISGSCTARHGWIAVRTATGRKGWASAYYLRRRTHHQAARRPAAPAIPPAFPARGCSYHWQGVQPSSVVTLRQGPGTRYRPSGYLRADNGRLAGSCTATDGWIAVKSATGPSGWAPGHYLRKV
ncbi:hypothetical protein N5079_30290 [Planotetraspora sp. A-T 1434]|uniref:SH3 domain-containing protein n=1 Tax=Planotetraspora sp. A-T 1434 TaxID=2979219 RepID=UPI0021BEBDB3|nr:hypothetical protein [Planotetraspora sp. A-T 1434]MCT9934504.1 hypothetical protein [Planotetraspora sp. A-T 1434]